MSASADSLSPKLLENATQELANSRSDAKKSKTAMVVEDDTLMRRFIVGLVNKIAPEVEVIAAINGKDAIARLAELRSKKRQDPAFIITDLMMPEMDGWELINHLKDEYEELGLTQGIPVIVLSGTSGEKGLLFRKSVHHGKSGYTPLISVAKTDCLVKAKYDTAGEQGLANWIRHFTR